MTAIAVYVGSDAIVAAADGIFYDYGGDGSVAGYGSKIHLYPERSALIAGSGMGGFVPALNWEINQSHSTFDELVADFDMLCFRVHYKLVGPVKKPEHDVCVVLAGYSTERGKYEAYRLVTYAKASESIQADDTDKVHLKPFRLHQIEGGWCSTRPPDHLIQKYRANHGDHFRPIDWSIRMVAACRANSGLAGQDDGSTRHFMAGGHCQVAVVQNSHIESWIAHRWPDVVGKPIDPDAGEPLPKYLMDIDNG